jgi:excisionase family DNA binding protein
MEWDGERLTMSVPEAAKVLGLSRGSAFEAVRRGGIPVLRIGRRLLVSRKRLQEIIEGRDGQ